MSIRLGFCDSILGLNAIGLPLRRGVAIRPKVEIETFVAYREANRTMGCIANKKKPVAKRRKVNPLSESEKAKALTSMTFQANTPRVKASVIRIPAEGRPGSERNRFAEKKNRTIFLNISGSTNINCEFLCRYYFVL